MCHQNFDVSSKKTSVSNKSVPEAQYNSKIKNDKYYTKDPNYIKNHDYGQKLNLIQTANK